MAVSYQLAQPADLDRLLLLIQAFCAEDQHPFEAEAVRQAVIDLMAMPHYGRIWLIEQDNHAIGYAVITLGYSLEYHGVDAFVDEIFVLASHRGQGIGTQTFAFLEDECRKLGVKALHLEVMPENARAYALYRALGYEDLHRIAMNKWL